MFRIKRCFLISLLLILTINVTAAQELIPPPQPENTLKPASDVKVDPALDGADLKRHGIVYSGEGMIPRPGEATTNSVRVPPTNDNFASAYDFGTVTSPETIGVGDIAESTVEQDELTFCRGRNNSVWFKFTVNTATVLDFNTFISTYDTVMTLYQYMPNGELSFRACNDDSGGLNSALYDVALKPGTYYVQVNAYGSSSLPLVATTLQLFIRPSDQGLPHNFNLLSPYSSLFPNPPGIFVWYASNGATTYQFVTVRTASDDGNPLNTVIDLPGLTPIADSDGLTCTDSFCTMFLPPSETAKLIGNTDTYAWYIVATNNHGSTLSYGYISYVAYEFYIDSDGLPLPFNLGSPSGEYTAAPSVFNWNESPGAELYNFYIEPVTNGITLIKPALTPTADADGLTCALQLYYFYCTLTLTEAETSLILDNDEYEWYVEAINGNGLTLECCNYFSVDSTPVPFDFYAYSPYYVVDMGSFSTFSIGEAYYADTYTITVDRTAPVAANIFNKIGLTPTDADSDNFYCNTGPSEKSPGYCYYLPTEAEKALMTSGDYTLSASAANENGTKNASNSPDDFFVNTDLAYELITPPADSAYAEVTDYPDFTTWEAITAAGWTYTYLNYSLSTSFAPFSLNMSFLTPGADFDRLTCAGGACSLDVSGTELGLFRSSFYWSVSSNGSLPSVSLGVGGVGGSRLFTIGDVPDSAQLLLNGSFEEKATRAAFPADWTAKNLVKAGVKCNKDKDGDGVLDKVFAYVGDCAMQMKGVGSTGKLQQTIPTEGLLAGDSLRFTGYVQTKSAVVGGQVRLKIKYIDENVDKTKFTLDVTPGTADYSNLTQTVGIASAPSKIKLDLRYTGVGGKVLFDNLGLYLTVPKPRTKDGLLALPDAITNGLDNRQNTEPNSLDSRQ